MWCSVQFVSCLHSVLIMSQAQHGAEEDTSVNQTLTSPEPGECECSVPNLESVLRERLQKIAGDEEVQDLARAILRHLTSVTGVSPSAAATASSPEVDFHSTSFLLNCPVLMTFSKVNTYLTQPDEGAHLSRSHALKGAAAEAAKASFKAHRAEVVEKDEPSPTSPSSLSIIQDIRSALTKLSAGFSPPPSLDFSDDEPDGLAYTPTNAPVRVYEHALNKLLERLDAVDSDGDEEVRVVRRAAVKEVEKAIEDVEKRIREARESAKPGTKAGSVVSAEADLTEGKNLDGAIDENPSVDKSKPEVEAEEPSSNSDDHVDSTPSGLEILPLPNPEVAIPDVANTTDAMSVQDADILDNQSSTPVVPVATPSLASTGQIEASVSTEVSSDDASESKLEALAQQATTNQVTFVPAPSEVTPLITPLDSPVEVSSPIFGAIAPSSTPVPPLVPSIIPEDLPVSLSHNRLSVPPGEGDADEDEDEWTKI